MNRTGTIAAIKIPSAPPISEATAVRIPNATNPKKKRGLRQFEGGRSITLVAQFDDRRPSATSTEAQNTRVIN